MHKILEKPGRLSPLDYLLVGDSKNNKISEYPIKNTQDDSKPPSPLLSYCVLFIFFEFLNLVDLHLQHAAAPEVGLGTHFLTEVVEKLVWFWQLFPDLGQKRCLMHSIRKHDSIDVRP